MIELFQKIFFVMFFQCFIKSSSLVVPYLQGIKNGIYMSLQKFVTAENMLLFAESAL